MANLDRLQLIWKNADAVTFDVDSTVIQEEGIDELAKFCKKENDVLALWVTIPFLNFYTFNFEKYLLSLFAANRFDVNNLRIYVRMYIIENDFQNKSGNAGRSDVSTVLDGKVEHHKTKLYTDRAIPGFPPAETLARNQVGNNF